MREVRRMWTKDHERLHKSLDQIENANRVSHRQGSNKVRRFENFVPPWSNIVHDASKEPQSTFRNDFDRRFDVFEKKIMKMWSQLAPIPPSKDAHNANVESPKVQDVKATKESFSSTHAADESESKTIVENKEEDVRSNSTEETKIYNPLTSAIVLTPQLFTSTTSHLLDLRTNPLQEEENDENKCEIDAVIEAIWKLMENIEFEELGFHQRWPVALKFIMIRLERKPI